MPTEIKLWKIDDDRPVVVSQQKLDLEARLEKWLKADISLISDALLVIGQQVLTDHGGRIDIVAMDPDANLVILELKRDKTPRDIVAQVLDYASWVEELSAERINEIGEGFLKDKTLEESFRDVFQEDLPEVLNERHRMYIVSSELDGASERIVKYLSESHGVDINVVTFAYFQTSEGELLGRSLLLDETQVETRAKSRSKRQPPRSWEELEGLAERQGVLDLYQKALTGLRPLFNGVNRTRTNAAFVGYVGENRSPNTILSVFPQESSEEKGLVLGLSLERLCEYFGVDQNQIQEITDSLTHNGDVWWQYAFHFEAESLGRLVALFENCNARSG